MLSGVFELPKMKAPLSGVCFRVSYIVDNLCEKALAKYVRVWWLDACQANIRQARTHVTSNLVDIVVCWGPRGGRPMGVGRSQVLDGECVYISLAEGCWMTASGIDVPQTDVAMSSSTYIRSHSVSNLQGIHPCFRASVLLVAFGR